MKTIVITGVTSGIGKTLMMALLEQGHTVIGIARSRTRLFALEADFKEKGYRSYALFKADFESLSDIRDVIGSITKRYPKGIDVLVNNAARMTKAMNTTSDGFEVQFQVNHLAPVLLTHGLLPLLKETEGTIITTASNAHRRTKYDPDDLEATRSYSPFRSYCRTKLYNILATRALRDLVLPKTGVKAYAVHPGLVRTPIASKDSSPLYRFSFWLFMKTRGIETDEAITTYIDLIDHGAPDDVFYIHDSKPGKLSKDALDDANRDDLWTKTLDMLDISF